MRTQIALSLLSASLLSLSASASPLQRHVGSYEVQVVTPDGQAPTYDHHGETYVMGQRGQRYTLRIHNHSSQRIEAVVSVDGRDVVDGKPADYRQKRGYLVPAWGYVDVDGWRLSQGEAAAFRFSSVANSYVGRTGSTREVGVIGVAVFAERYVPPPPPPRPLYVPHGPRYGLPYDERGEEQDDKRKSAPSMDAPAPSTVAPDGLSRSHAGAGALAERETRQRDLRPGLGTGFGERVTSPVEEVVFYRQHPTVPAAILGVRYNDRAGLLAMGVDVDGNGSNLHDVYLRRTAEPFAVPERRYASPPPYWPY